MGYVFQDEWKETHPSGCHFSLLMAKEIEKYIGKGKEALFGILFMKIGEKGRLRVIYLHERQIREKMKENERKRRHQ